MIITKNHVLNSKKVRKDIVIAQLSDLHYNDFTDPKKLVAIYLAVMNINPDYIIFCGDIFFSKSHNYDNLIEFFSILSKIAPLYITLGNHDVMTLANKTKGIKDLKWVEYVETAVLDKLKDMNNVKIVDNETVPLDEYNVLLTGINMGFKHYAGKDMGFNQYEKGTQESPADFVSTVNKLFRDVQDERTFNQISCHSPLVILNPEHFIELGITYNADLIHCGHMHHGAVPPGFGVILPKNKGIIDPHGNRLPKLARGEVRINGAFGIIGGPLTTIAECQGAKAKLINMACPSRIDAVLVKKMR